MNTVAMSQTAFTLWIVAATLCGVIMGLLLARVVWIALTDYGTHAAPRLIMRLQRQTRSGG
jgi:hypothetical protein